MEFIDGILREDETAPVNSGTRHIGSGNESGKSARTPWRKRPCAVMCGKARKS